MNKKILITGIDSFTGQHLSLYLEHHGYEVYGTSLSKKSHKVYICDITIKEDIARVINDLKPDYLIHLAGITFVAHKDNNEFYRVNSIGSINILKAFIQARLNPKKIIMVSSATVYGDHEMEILDESIDCRPTNHYGASKYSMECLCNTYFQKFNILIVRPFNYTGVGQSIDFLIPKIISHYKENSKTIELGNINVSREFNDIGFVCEVYKRLIESDAKSKVLNIASGRGVQLLSIIQHMNKIAKYEIEVSVDERLVRSNEIHNLVGSSDLLFKLIGKVEQKDIGLTLRDMYDA
jgi:GDP-6-deoxy-D-talose 4-dehydrogenase